MTLKSFYIVFGSFVFTTALLYSIGHLFNVPMFMFRYEYTDIESGFIITTGSVLPFLIALAVSFVVEKLYQFKQRKKLG